MSLPAIINKTQYETEQKLLLEYLDERNSNLLLLERYLDAPKVHYSYLGNITNSDAGHINHSTS